MEVSAVIWKVLWKCFSLIPFLTLQDEALWGKSVLEAGTHVIISVYNDAGVPPGTLRQAEGEAARVFRQAGIEVRWLNCGVAAAAKDAEECLEAVFPTHLHLRIVRKARDLKEETLGISFLAADGRGTQADLFYEPMEQLCNSKNTNLASLLGHVAAHEVGHLLLGANSHAPTGVMGTHWASEGISIVELGQLFFSGEESERMRQRLSIRTEGTDIGAQITSPH